jgi:hypothetical protein
MRRGLLSWLAAGFIGVATIWNYWTSLLDGLGHVMATIGIFTNPDDLSAGFKAWVSHHPNLLSEFAPYILYVLGIAILITAWALPFVERLLIRKELDSAHGWSVSITVPSGIFGIVAGNEDSCLIFQQFRFSNASATRPRRLDVEIYSKYHPDGRDRLLYRSTDGTVTQYQRNVEASTRGNRMLNCIEFPLQLEPSGLVEGQIVIPLPEDLRKRPAPNQHPMIAISNGLRFVFTEHISGRQIELRGGDYFDATKGEAQSRIRHPTRIALLKLWWRSQWNKRS